MDIKLEEVELRMNFFLSLIMELKVCTNNLDQIQKAYLMYDNKVKPLNNFFTHYADLCYTSCVITLCKLLSNKSNERLSLVKFFNILENGSYHSCLKSHLKNNKKRNKAHLVTNKDEIKSLTNQLRMLMLEKESITQKILNRRDSFYAHTDLNQEGIEPEKLYEIKELKNIAEKVYSKLNSAFFDTSFIFSPERWSIKPVLKNQIELFNLKFEDPNL